MTGELPCGCGYVAAAENEDDLVAAVRDHASTVHGIDLTEEVLLGLVDQRGPLAGSDPRP
jgi:predicted small metal-binding protein